MTSFSNIYDHRTDACLVLCQLSFLSSRAREPVLPAALSQRINDGASDAGSSEMDSPAQEESLGTEEKKKRKRGFLSLFKSKDKVRRQKQGKPSLLEYKQG